MSVNNLLLLFLVLYVPGLISTHTLPKLCPYSRAHWTHGGSCSSHCEVLQAKISLFQTIIVVQTRISMINRLVNNLNSDRLLAFSFLIRKEWQTTKMSCFILKAMVKLGQSPHSFINFVDMRTCEKQCGVRTPQNGTIPMSNSKTVIYRNSAKRTLCKTVTLWKTSVTLQ